MGQSLDLTWTAERDAASWGSGCPPFCPDPRCTHYLGENAGLLRPRGVCALRARSDAAPQRTGSSPGRAAAGSPGSSDHRGAAPSQGCSAEDSSPLLRWRSSCSRYHPRYRCHCLQRCRLSRNDKNQTETATASWGGPWLEEKRAVVDGRDGKVGLERWTSRNRQEPFSSDCFSLSSQLPLMTTGCCECFLRHLKPLFLNNEMRYLEAAGFSPHMLHKHNLHQMHTHLSEQVNLHLYEIGNTDRS